MRPRSLGRPVGRPNAGAFSDFTPDPDKSHYRQMANVPTELMPQFVARLNAMHKSASWYLVELVRRDLETYDENTPLPEWWDDVEAQGSLIQLRPGGGFAPASEAVAAIEATDGEEARTAKKTG